ncbi:MAG: alkaline phosphatase D family protein [Planctomycetota bacterium]
MNPSTFGPQTIHKRWAWPGLLLVVFSVNLPAFWASAPAQAAPQTNHTSTLTRIAFGSCAKETSPQPIWDVVLERDPGLFILAGDNVYGDTDDPAVLRMKYERFAAVPGFARLRETVPVLATWDDHDFGRNDAGTEYEMKRESQQVFLDFFGVPSDSPRRTREGVYHAETFGPEGRRVQVILLDTRYHRSALERFSPEPGRRRGAYRPRRDRDATMLGDAQWSWLESQLRQPADIRLIVSSIQFVAEDHRHEKWGNLPRERRRMLNLIRDTGAQGVVFLSGDRHHAELSRLERSAPGYSLYYLTASGLTQSRARGGRFRVPEYNRSRVAGPFRGQHFGMVDIDWDQPEPAITLQIINADGTAVIRETVHRNELQRGGEAQLATAKSSPSDVAVVQDQMTTDGDIDDWRTPGLLYADDRNVYGRFLTTERTLRRHAETVIVGFDLDGDAATGDGGGLDLAFHIGPPPAENGRRRRGPLVVHHGADRQPREISDTELIRALGFHIGPTHASDWHEFRLRRDAARTLGLNPDSPPRSPLRVVVRGIDKETSVSRVIAEASVTPPAASWSAETGTASSALPTKADGAVRLVCFNVLWATPQEDPAPFGRLLKATRPDIYLIQEWDQSRYSVAEICAWFKEHVDPNAEWSAMVTGIGGRGSGTAVVTPHPMTAKLPPHVPVATARWDFPARIAGAAVDTPSGRFVVGNVHFKAGGALDSDEDIRRRAEAEAVNRLLVGLSAAVQPDVVVLGGDFNLNGSTEIAEIATRGLDLDLSDLATARPQVLGQPGLVYTHGRGPSKNRLDFITYSDATAQVTAAFVLDTTVLDDAALQAANLQRTDSHASDHLPVFVDLLPRGYRPPTSGEVAQQHPGTAR